MKETNIRLDHTGRIGAAWPWAVFALVLMAVTYLALGPNGGTRASAAEGQPGFLLPWEDGQEWLTGIAGFHGGHNALDFFPPDTPIGGDLHCEGDPEWAPEVSDYWVVASGPGTVVTADGPEVVIDDGNGWRSGYYHLHDLQVKAGDEVPPNWRLGHASNYGDCATGAHVHFWVEGPNGEALPDVTISTLAATDIDINEWLGGSGNFPPDGAPTPTPTPVPTPTPKPTAEPTPAPVRGPLGDVDCNASVDSLDALAIMRTVAGLPANAACLPRTGDVNCDLSVDIEDALHVLRYVAGLDPTVVLPCPLPPA